VSDPLSDTVAIDVFMVTSASNVRNS
jgi:hypothetical protein